MTDRNAADDAVVQEGVVQHETQQTDSPEQVPNSTSPALSNTSSTTAPSQLQTEGSIDQDENTDASVSSSAKDLDSAADNSGVCDSKHALDARLKQPHARGKLSSSSDLNEPRTKKNLTTKVSSPLRVSTLQALPLEILSNVCNFLSPEDNHNFVKMAEDVCSESLTQLVNDMCQKMISAGNTAISHTVGHGLVPSDLTPRTLAFLREHCKSIRSIFIDTTILRDYAALKKFLDCVKESNLELISFYPITEITSDEIYDALSRLYEQQNKAKFIVVPRRCTWVQGRKFKVGLTAAFCSIIEVEGQGGSYRSVVTRVRGDLAMSRRLIDQHGGKIKQATFVCGRDPGVIQRGQIEAMNNTYPMEVEKLRLYSCDTRALEEHFMLGNITGIALLFATYDDQRRQNEEEFYKTLVDCKVSSDNTYIQEVMHISNSQNDSDCAASITEETLENLTTNLKGVETFCWHQKNCYEKPIGQTVANWNSSLRSFSYRNGAFDMSYDDIREVFRGAKSIVSFGCDHGFYIELLEILKDNAAGIKKGFEQDGELLAKAISPEGIHKSLNNLVFFVDPKPLGGLKFPQRIEIIQTAITHLINELAAGGVYVQMLHVVPRGMSLAPKFVSLWDSTDRAISFRIRAGPDEAFRSVTGEMKHFSKPSSVVTLANHLSPNEQNDLFLLGGISDNNYILLEQNVTRESIPWCENAQDYYNRVTGQGRFGAAIQAKLALENPQPPIKRAGPNQPPKEEKRPKSDEGSERGNGAERGGGKRGGTRGGRRGGRGGKRTV